MWSAGPSDDGVAGCFAVGLPKRQWRKVSTDWTAWLRRDLGGEDVVRLILDGTVVRVRLDRKATGISLLVVLGVRRDGQKVLLSIKNMGGESEAGWRGVLDDLVARGLRTPEFLMVDGGAGLDRALSGLWPDVPVQRCTVHKHRNLLAHAPDSLHDEISADYSDMIYAATAAEVQFRRRAFLRKWRLRCPAVATSLEEAGERLFSFLRLPPSPPWRLTWQLDRNKSIPSEKRRSGQFHTHRDGTVGARQSRLFATEGGRTLDVPIRRFGSVR